MSDFNFSSDLGLDNSDTDFGSSSTRTEPARRVDEEITLTSDYNSRLHDAINRDYATFKSATPMSPVRLPPVATVKPDTARAGMLSRVVSSVSDAISSIMPKFHVTHHIDSDSIKAAFSVAADSSSDIAKKVIKDLSLPETWAKIVYNLIRLIAAIHIIRYSNEVSVVTAALVLFVDQSMATKIMGTLMPLFKRLYNKSTQAQALSDIIKDARSFVSDVSAGIATLLTSIFEIQDPLHFMHSCAWVARDFSSLYKGAKDVTEVMAAFFNHAIAFAETAICWATGYGPWLNYTRTENSLKAFDEELLFLKEHASDPIPILRPRITKLLLALDAITDSSGKDGHPPSLANRCYQRWRTVSEILKGSAPNVPHRARPVVVLIYGKPGAGKSTYVTHTASPIISSVLSHPVGVYQRSPRDQFWSGYSGQDITVIDDPTFFYQQESRDAAIAEFAQLCSDTTLLLNMGDLSEKGRTLFTSNFIFITSNSPDITENSGVANIEAFWRRIDIVANIQVVDGARRFVVKSRDAKHLPTPRENQCTLDESDFALYCISRMLEHKANYKERVDKYANMITDVSVRNKMLERLSSMGAHVSMLPPAETPVTPPEAPRSNFSTIIRAVLGVAVFAGASYAAYNYIAPSNDPASDTAVEQVLDFVAQSALPGNKTGVVARRTQGMPQIKLKLMNPVGQSNSSPDDFIKAKVKKNVTHLTVALPTGQNYTTICTMIKKNIGILPTHWLDVVLPSDPEGTVVHVVWASGHVTVPLSCVTFRVLPNRDITFAVFEHKQFPSFPAIDDNLIRRSDLEKGIGPCTLAHLDAEGNLVIRDIHEPYVSRSTISYEGGAGEVECALAISGKAYTQKGDCMSPWFARSTQVQNRIVGFHIAGNGSTGVAHCSVLPKEDWEEIERHHLTSNVTEAQAQFESSCSTFVRQLNPSEQVHLPSRTAQVPSLFWEHLVETPTKVPAAMAPFRDSEGNRISPFEKGVERLFSRGEEHPDYRADMGKVAAEIVAACFPKEGLGPLTLEETLNGSAENPYISGIVAGTSAGWNPGVQVGGTKEIFLDGEPGNYRLSPLGAQAYEQAGADQEHRSIPTLSVHMKQELLPIEKVKVGRTRLTHCMRFGDFVLGKQLFGRLIAWVMANRESQPYKMGVNPHSAREWTDLARYLGLDEPDLHQFFAGDYSNYDGSQNRILVELGLYVFEIIFGKESPQHVFVCRFMRCRNLVLGAFLMRVSFGHCTGWILTTLWNCILAHIANVYTKLMFLLENPRDALATSVDKDRLAIFGDDHVDSVPKNSKIKWEHYVLYNKHLGLKLTAADKVSLSGSFAAKEITFLQRSFIKCGDLFAAPLSGEHLVNMLAWRQRKEDPLKAAESSALAYCTESFLLCVSSPGSSFTHKETAYDRSTALVRKVLKEYGSTVTVPSYRSLMFRWTELGQESISIWVVQRPIRNSYGAILANLGYGWALDDDEENDYRESMAKVIQGATITEAFSKKTEAQSAPITFEGKGKQIGNESTSEKYHYSLPPIKLPDTFAATAGMQTSFNTSILEKDYALFDLDFNATAAVGDRLGAWDPYTWLASRGFVSPLIGWNTRFRADIVVTVKMTAAAFNQGALQISWASNRAPDSYPMTCPMWQASNLDSAVLCCNQSNEVSFVIKYDSPAYWTSMPSYIPGSLGSFRIDVVVPVTTSTSSGITSIPINVFGRLTNVQVDGAIDAGPSSRRTVAQSSMKAWHTKMFAPASETVWEDETAPPRDKIEDVHDTVRGMWDNMENKMAKVTMAEDARSTAAVQNAALSAVHRAVPPVKEQASTSNHTTSNVFASVSAISGAAAVFPPLAPFALPIAAISAAVGGIARMFGHDKPISDLSAQPMIMTTTRGNATLHGNVLAETTGVSDQVAVGFDGFVRDRKDYNILANLLTRPQLVVTDFPPASPNQVGLRLADHPVCPTFVDGNCGFGPLQTIGALFTHWRGSLKYHLMIPFPSFASAKVRVIWTPTRITEYPDTGTVFSHVVDVSGETHYSFTVPFTGALYRPNNTSNFNGDRARNLQKACNGWISFWLDSTVVFPTSTTMTRVPIVLWQSAGSDFVYLNPSSWNPYEEPTRAQAIPSMEELFEQPSEFFVRSNLSVVTNGPLSPVTNLRSLLHRFNVCTQIFVTVATLTQKPLREVLSLNAPFYLCCRMFSGFMGSFNLRLRLPPTTGSLYITQIPADTALPIDISHAGVVPFTASTTEERFYTIHLPMLSEYRYYTSGQIDPDDTSSFESKLPTLLLYWTGVEPVNVALSVAVGDDFSFVMPTAGIPFVDFSRLLRRLKNAK